MFQSITELSFEYSFSIIILIASLGYSINVILGNYTTTTEKQKRSDKIKIFLFILGILLIGVTIILMFFLNPVFCPKPMQQIEKEVHFFEDKPSLFPDYYSEIVSSCNDGGSCKYTNTLCLSSCNKQKTTCDSECYSPLSACEEECMTESHKCLDEAERRFAECKNWTIKCEIITEKCKELPCQYNCDGRDGEAFLPEFPELFQGCLDGTANIIGAEYNKLKPYQKDNPCQKAKSFCNLDTQKSLCSPDLCKSACSIEYSNCQIPCIETMNSCEGGCRKELQVCKKKACDELEYFRNERPLSKSEYLNIIGNCSFGSKPGENINYLYCQRNGHILEKGEIGNYYEQTLVYELTAILEDGTKISNYTPSSNTNNRFVRSISYRLTKEDCNLSLLTFILNGTNKYLIIVLFLLFIFIFYLIFSEDEIEKPENVISNKENMPEIIMDIKDLTIKYGDQIIINNISFRLFRNKLYCLIGHSGVGKSAIIECLVGRRRPSYGSISVLGKEPEFKREEIGFVPQSSELYLNQSVWQNMINSAIKWGIKSPEKKISETLQELELSQKRELPANKLSGGQLKILSIGTELIRDPPLLILDEPTSGLDPSTRSNIISLLDKLASGGKLILFSSHFMDDAECSDEIMIIHDRTIIAKSSPEGLVRSLPNKGNLISVTLETINLYLIQKIHNIDSVQKILIEGRTVKILGNNLDLRVITDQIADRGGNIVETKITKATMTEIFMFYTGTKLEEK